MKKVLAIISLLFLVLNGHAQESLDTKMCIRDRTSTKLEHDISAFESRIKGHMPTMGGMA